MTRILAIDLGKFKSVACLYTAESSDPVFQTVQLHWDRVANCI